MSLKTLFVSSEIYPFAKSGGLADVSYALPKALSENIDVTLIMPLYRSVDRKKFNISSSGVTFKLTIDSINYEIEYFFALYNGLKCYFLYSEILSERDNLYGTASSGYEDNDIRFGLFCHAVIYFVENFATTFDVLHINDWQSAMCALLVREKKLDLKTVFTIHNLAYQGIFEKSSLERLDLGEEYFNQEALEYYGDVSFLKAGVAYSDHITTVSPNYAKEILTKEYGSGLEGFLQVYSHKLSGILNGIDIEDFSPKTDSALWENYDAKLMSAKQTNKRNFLETVNLLDEKRPLFIFIGRFTWQKGMELLINSLKEIAALDVNIAILGDGEEKYHKAFNKVAQKYENLHVRFGYDEKTSRRMYAASDYLLMPSAFEPCGLNQMIAMNYGTIPIVRAVGGLKDSVKSIEKFNSNDSSGFGIVFKEMNRDVLVQSCKDAITLYNKKQLLRKIKRHNMNQDFSWKNSALEYEKIYKNIVTK